MREGPRKWGRLFLRRALGGVILGIYIYLNPYNCYLRHVPERLESMLRPLWPLATHNGYGGSKYMRQLS